MSDQQGWLRYPGAHQRPSMARCAPPRRANVTTAPALPSQTIGDAHSGIPWQQPGCATLVQHNRDVGSAWKEWPGPWWLSALSTLILRPLWVEMRRRSVALLVPLYPASGRSAALSYLFLSVRGVFRDPATNVSALCRSAHRGSARHSHSPCLQDRRARAPHAARQKAGRAHDRAQPAAAAPSDPS